MRLSLAIVFAALSLAACTPAARLTAPSGFVHVAGEYDDRVATARGVTVGVKVEANDPKGNLDFWAEVLDVRLRNHGYVVDGDATEVKAKSGATGKQLKYTFFDGSRTNRYWLTLFVSSNDVVLVEAAGDIRDFDASRTQVEDSILSVRAN